MNKLINIIVAILFLTIVTNAQDSQADSIKSTIDKLFKFSKAENFEASGKLIAYDGNDQTRFLNTSLNFSDTKEAIKIKRIVKRVKAFVDISDSYSFGKLELVKDSKANLFKIEVLFKSGEHELKTSIIIVNAGSKFLVTDLK